MPDESTGSHLERLQAWKRGGFKGPKPVSESELRQTCRRVAEWMEVRDRSGELVLERSRKRCQVDPADPCWKSGREACSACVDSAALTAEIRGLQRQAAIRYRYVRAAVARAVADDAPASTGIAATTATETR